MTASKKKPGSAVHAIAAVAKAAEEESDVVVVCLRVAGGTRISIDVARSRHDGTNRICVMGCGNQCVNGGRKH